MNSSLRISSLVVGLTLSACADRVATFDDFPIEGQPPEAGARAGAGASGSAGASATSGGGSAVTAGATGGGASATSGGAATAGATGGGASATGGGASATSGGGSAVTAGATSGGAATAGTSGAGGPPIVNPVEAFDLIDDAEVGFPALPRRAGRNGAWFSVHDESGGSVSPAQALSLNPARGSSHLAASIKGGGFTDWGAQLGASLKSPVTGYDASAYCGVRFFAKGKGDGWTLLISDRNSSPNGGVCSLDSDDPTKWCYDYPGKGFTPSADWQLFELHFADLSPLKGYTGQPRTLDKSAVFDIIFNFWSPNGAAFDLLIDDLSFLMSCD
jgi:hypothetical protein